MNASAMDGLRSGAWGKRQVTDSTASETDIPTAKKSTPSPDKGPGVSQGDHNGRSWVRWFKNI